MVQLSITHSYSTQYWIWLAFLFMKYICFSSNKPKQIRFDIHWSNRWNSLTWPYLLITVPGVTKHTIYSYHYWGLHRCKIRVRPVYLYDFYTGCGSFKMDYLGVCYHVYVPQVIDYIGVYSNVLMWLSFVCTPGCWLFLQTVYRGLFQCSKHFGVYFNVFMIVQ